MAGSPDERSHWSITLLTLSRGTCAQNLSQGSKRMLLPLVV